uniref:Uncharacterized protein n=1 Tax=Romanomermis culicivorax TaxID=13658 RepID=A0A915IM42_ROMCU
MIYDRSNKRYFNTQDITAPVDVWLTLIFGAESDKQSNKLDSQRTSLFSDYAAANHTHKSPYSEQWDKYWKRVPIWVQRNGR